MLVQKLPLTPRGGPETSDAGVAIVRPRSDELRMKAMAARREQSYGIASTGVREKDESRVMPASLPENQVGGGRCSFTERGSPAS